MCTGENSRLNNGVSSWQLTYGVLYRRSKRGTQGFVNLAHSGDEDGGLVVLKEGHKISEEYHNAFREEDRGFRWTNEVSDRPQLEGLILES